MTDNVIKQWIFNKRFYLITFAVPVIIMYFVYAVFGVHPFGDNSVLVLDLNGQYVYYYEHLRDIFWSDKSLLYSWSRNLSGEFLGIYAYYLASPFSIIPILLPRSMMLGALELMQLMKIGAAALAFAVYLKNQKGSRVFTIIIFSTLYSLMSYCVVQLMNPMWLDGLIYLPLIIMGVERLIDNGRMKGLIIPLALMFISNYYIGYMVGIFTGLYFIQYIIVSGKYTFKKGIIKTLIKAVISVAVAVMCAMVIILPAYNSLKLGKLEFTEPDLTVKSQFTIEQFLSKLLPFSYDTVRPEGLPIVFCGCLTLLLVPLYFLNKKIDSKRKIASGALLVAIFLCMYISIADLVWHGFQVPNWLPFRYSFIFCFIMLVMAADAFEKLDGVSHKQICGSFFGIIIFLCYIEGRGFKHIPAIKTILPSALIITIYFVVLLGYKKHKTATNAIITIIFICAEMFTVSLNTLDRINKDVLYSKFSSYHDYVDDGRKAVETINEMDDGLFRSEKTFHRTVNDPMAFGLNGLSHSSSTMNSPVIEMMRKLGFTSRGHSTRYTGATEITDSIFGVKYILNKDKNLYNYDYLLKNNDIEIYKNPYALSMGFMSDNNIRKVNIENVNPFENQNALINSMTGSDESNNIFKPIIVDNINYENITVENAGDHTKYSPTVQGINAHIEFNITAPTDDVIYAFFPSNYERSMNIWVNKEFIDFYYEADNYCIVRLGKFDVGEKVSIITTPTKEDLYMMDQYFYYLDKDTFEKTINTLKNNQWNITKHTDTYLEGKVTAQNNQILYTSIPYEKGWTIKVDGKKVKPVVLVDSLIGIEVTEGTHTVTMRFLPDYLIKGIIISVVGVILLIAIIVLEKRCSKKNIKVEKDAESGN